MLKRDIKFIHNYVINDSNYSIEHNKNVTVKTKSTGHNCRKVVYKKNTTGGNGNNEGIHSKGCSNEEFVLMDNF